MFSIKEIKNGLLGCLEIFLFMPKSMERFGKSKSDALKSLVIPALMFPLGIVLMVLRNEGTADVMIFVHSARYLMCFCLSLYIIYLIAGQLERKDHFFHFVSAYNWSSFIGFMFLIPIFYHIFLHPGDWGAIENYAIFVTVFIYVLIAFIATHSLRINWYLGGFIGIVNLAVNNIGHDITKLLQDSFVAGI